MRIAVTGTHLVGKSTLIELVGERLPDYRTIDEPYLLLEEEGYEFASPPSLEDFMEQLRRSMELIEEEDARNVLFDCRPLDFLGTSWRTRTPIRSTWRSGLPGLGPSSRRWGSSSSCPSKSVIASRFPRTKSRS